MKLSERPPLTSAIAIFCQQPHVSGLPTIRADLG
jgi:hypothetical protein